MGWWNNVILAKGAGCTVLLGSVESLWVNVFYCYLA